MMHPWVESYATYLEVERNLSPRTRSAYVRDLLGFCTFLCQDTNENADLEVLLGTVTRVKVRRWLAQLRRRQKKVTVARKISSLKGFYAYA
ncbi:MAG: site-specific integrase, partial [Geobacteraceae bacterium]|nr:site-specific integrase [Geobacteraceae bacterium]